MRVLILSCVYPPEPSISGRVCHDVAVGLRTAGHDVRVIAPFPSKPGGRPYRGYRRSPWQRDTVDGVRVLRCSSLFSQSSTMGSRLAENLSFGLASALALMFAEPADVLYSNSWPVVATALAVSVARARGIRVALAVQDIYPESLEAQGRTGAGSRVFRAVRAVDTWCARSSSRLLVISESFAAAYRRRGVDPDRISVVPNWLPADAVTPPSDRAAFRREAGIPDDGFLVVYGGNVGAAAGVERVIAASHVLDRPNIHLLIAGEGSRLDACRRLAAAGPAAARLRFHSPWPAADTSRVLGAADLLILPTQGAQSLVSIPSKLISYMLSGRPTLAVVRADSDTARVLDEAACGWSVVPDDPAALADALGRIAALPTAEREARGQRGRDHALRHFTSEAGIPAVSRLLENIVYE